MMKIKKRDIRFFHSFVILKIGKHFICLWYSSEKYIISHLLMHQNKIYKHKHKLWYGFFLSETSWCTGKYFTSLLSICLKSVGLRKWIFFCLIKPIAPNYHTDGISPSLKTLKNEILIKTEHLKPQIFCITSKLKFLLKLSLSSSFQPANADYITRIRRKSKEEKEWSHKIAYIKNYY